jgi:hypothetical protein
MVSFDLTIEDFIGELDSRTKLLENLMALTTWNFNEGKYMGAVYGSNRAYFADTNLDTTIPTNVAIAIVHNIRSIMLLEIHGEDRHTAEVLLSNAVIDCSAVRSNKTSLIGCSAKSVCGMKAYG